MEKRNSKAAVQLLESSGPGLQEIFEDGSETPREILGGRLHELSLGDDGVFIRRGFSLQTLLFLFTGAATLVHRYLLQLGQCLHPQ